MTLLVDLFGFLSVLLRGSALALAAFTIGGVIFRYAVVAPWQSPANPALYARLAGFQCTVASALVATLCIAKALDLSILISTIEIGWARALSAPFVLAGLVSAAASALLAWLAWRAGAARPGRFWCEGILAVVLLGSIIATTHATGRIEARQWLLVLSFLHQAGGAAWIGGLPYFLFVLAAALPASDRAALAHRYSWVCVIAVAAVAGSALGKTFEYVGVPGALYGTAYGLMTATKGVMFAALLVFGAGNFWAVRRLPHSAAATPRTQRFVEVELAIGLGVFFVAGSLTSLPPAVDLPHDRVPWQTIVERVLTPKQPQLQSPDHSELWYETAQAELDVAAAAAREAAPRAFVPGAGILYPRSAADIAWSEYNHNWAGVFVLAIGLLAMLAWLPQGRWARHWPMLFVALGVFIAIRADPESWPLGSIGFFEAFREPGVVQHRLMTLLVIVFGVFEWRVRVGELATTRAVYVFPVSNILGGILMLTHSHVLENIQAALLIEMSHIPIGLLAIAGGSARWLELRADSPIRERAGRVWPMAFVLVGLVLLFYRES